MSKNKEKEKELEAEEKEAPAEEVKEESTAETDPKDKEIASLKDQLMRNMAEYDNYRKRTARERTELTPEITARIVGEFLPVLDNLERALQTETTDEKYKEGVKLIYDSFMGTMDKLGVEKVQTEDFDPSVHQAVQQVESDLESGKIVSVFQNGYKIGTKVLRFAMVTVAQ
ncbi:MAG: nucleotide exchange factor GrpE [Ruminiclostridium sp.]|nr:nucleotide exchange factor GrpE [Ruminiclostridium sp.]MBQ8843097.1 nucleotide exchange factor GrpE [Ruminiclostridium sp.]